jgi:hypothetical protein
MISTSTQTLVQMQKIRIGFPLNEVSQVGSNSLTDGINLVIDLLIEIENDRDGVTHG